MCVFQPAAGTRRTLPWLNAIEWRFSREKSVRPFISAPNGIGRRHIPGPKSLSLLHLQKSFQSFPITPRPYGSAYFKQARTLVSSKANCCSKVIPVVFGNGLLDFFDLTMPSERARPEAGASFIVAQ